jgi:hypothetical protein
MLHGRCGSKNVLWDALAINGYAIEACDGKLGIVSDLLFEDDGWIIRWLVVDIGHRLPGRKVLLPLSALGQPDRALRSFPVKLTMQQVEDSPDVDTDQTVSRQIEAHVYDYYGWDPYWGGGFHPISNAMATPFVTPLFLSAPMPRDPTSADTRSHESDPHLRSIAVIARCHVHATDGEIGHIDGFLVDSATWSIRYIVVDTRNWKHGENVLVSSRSIREIDWANSLIHLDVDRQKLKGSPTYDPSIPIDRACEEEILAYYGIGWAVA